MKKSFIVAGISLTSFLVFTAFASAQTVNATQQAVGGINSLSGIVDAITKTLVKALGSLAMAAGVVAFFYGVVEYIWGLREGKTDKIVAGRQFMIWGIIALFVMFSVYGFINFGQKLFFSGVDVTKIVIPEFNFVGGGVTTPNKLPADPYANPDVTQQANGKYMCPDGTTISTPDPASCPKSTCPDGTTYIRGTAASCPATAITVDSANANGWQYFSDGTSIGPDGTYYINGQPVNSQNVNSAATDAVQSGGAGGGVTSDCSNASAGDICDAGYDMTGTCQLNSEDFLECSTN